MKKAISTALGLFLAFIILMSSLSASAQSYSVDPASGFYGEVEIGSSANLIFTITSTFSTPVTIYGLELTTTEGELVCGVDVTCDFAITSVTNYFWDPPVTCGTDMQGCLPAILPNGYYIEVEVTFSPTTLGDHDAFVHIISNSSNSVEYVPLYGKGIEAPVEPGDMAALIDFFDASVAGGFLVGEGSGRSAPHRIKAFGNMLHAASDLIESGDYDLACIQLQDALNRTDGLEPPPDFVDGANREVLATMIIEMMDTLACP